MHPSLAIVYRHRAAMLLENQVTPGQEIVVIETVPPGRDIASSLGSDLRQKGLQGL
jgi:hypothetical protein